MTQDIFKKVQSILDKEGVAWNISGTLAKELVSILVEKALTNNMDEEQKRKFEKVNAALSMAGYSWLGPAIVKRILDDDSLGGGMGATLRPKPKTPSGGNSAGDSSSYRESGGSFLDRLREKVRGSASRNT